MGVLPQVNATLLSVSRPSSSGGGYTEDYDRPATAATPIWTGTEDAYVQRKIVSNFGGDDGELRRVLEVTLYLSEDLSVGIEPGDTLVYSAGDPNNPTTFAGRVQNFTNPAFLPTLQDYFKVALEDTNVPQMESAG